MKLILKGCQRCGGDLMPDYSERDEVALSCVQCGHTVYAVERPSPMDLPHTRRLPIEAGVRRGHRSPARV